MTKHLVLESTYKENMRSFKFSRFITSEHDDALPKAFSCKTLELDFTSVSSYVPLPLMFVSLFLLL